MAHGNGDAAETAKECASDSADLGRLEQEWGDRQNALAARVVECDSQPLGDIRLVGGTDISFVKDSLTQACASLVVLDARTLEVVYEDCRLVEMTLPYIPGFLAFREAAHLELLLARLRTEHPELYPQVVLVDGNGTFHPRRCGIASHLGVVCDTPTIGVGKTLFHLDGISIDTLRPQFAQRLRRGGDYFDIVGDSGRVWGRALRTVDGAHNPLFVSVGHRVSLESATNIVLRMSRFRVPEPIRQADQRSRAVLAARNQPAAA